MSKWRKIAFAQITKLLNFSRVVSCHLTFGVFASTLFNSSYLAIPPTLLGVLAVTL